jgi:cytosine/adenosine deaminase-related metal-dependent hydrolase
MLITHGLIATLNEDEPLIADGALHVAEGLIDAVGSTAELRVAYPHDNALDAHGQWVLPGAICAHTHFYGAFARGMAIPGEPASNFAQILERLWWRLDRALTPEDVRYSALVCLADAVRHGTTTVIDHHASPNAIEGSLDVIAGAVREAGLRASLCYEVTDRDGPERAQAGIAENLRFARWLANHPSHDHPMLAASFGLHASLTLSDKTLRECLAAASQLNTPTQTPLLRPLPMGASESAGRGSDILSPVGYTGETEGGRPNLGFHIHLAEDAADQEDSLRKYGKRVTHRLHDAGILGPNTIAAHGVHLAPGEIALLAETGTWVTHQPRSNMNNAVGVAPVEAMLQHGVNLGLGNDGFSNNMLAEMKAAYLVHKLNQRDPRAMPGDRVTRLAYAENARLARVFWPDLILGQLRPGAAADLVLLDYHPTTPLSAGNLPWHLLFGVEASTITTTICAGRVLMRDRRLLTLDEERITARSRELAAALWERL